MGARSGSCNDVRANNESHGVVVGLELPDRLGHVVAVLLRRHEVGRGRRGRRRLPRFGLLVVLALAVLVRARELLYLFQEITVSGYVSARRWRLAMVWDHDANLHRPDCTYAAMRVR